MTEADLRLHQGLLTLNHLRYLLERYRQVVAANPDTVTEVELVSAEYRVKIQELEVAILEIKAKSG